jgi:hypothetical protein
VNYFIITVVVCLLFADLKMADSVNVWDFPINFFSRFRSPGVASKPTKGTSR